MLTKALQEYLLPLTSKLVLLLFDSLSFLLILVHLLLLNVTDTILLQHPYMAFYKTNSDDDD